METKYGVPFIFEDKTGLLTGSEFFDLHDRMKLVYRCTARDSSRGAVYKIYDNSPGVYNQHVAVITLTFNADNTLGTIAFGSGEPKTMRSYLTRVNNIAGGTLRRFYASDGREYRWGWRLSEGHEWACTNSDAELISSYSLKIEGEPSYAGTSGCVFTVEEAYPHLVAEMVASLMIMRQIVQFDLIV